MGAAAICLLGAPSGEKGCRHRSKVRSPSQLVSQRKKTSRIQTGGTYTIAPGMAHLIDNEASVDCRFLLLQGVDAYDWVKAEQTP
jgi:hypothetical protein